MNDEYSSKDFAEDVKSLAALQDIETWEKETNPWSAVGQVLAVTCMKVNYLQETEGLSEYEKELATTLSGAVHAACLVLETLQDEWYDNREGDK